VSAVVEVRGVTKGYGTRRVLHEVSVSIEAGQLVAVVGRSGSGKTTLLSLLAGFIAPDSGSIEGVAEAWSETALVPQTLGLLDELTALENVAAPLRLTGTPRREAEAGATATLGELGLGEMVTRFVGEISAGQRQRVGLARALVGGPRVLLADEPTSHLDDDARALVLAAIRRRVATGTAAVLVTHDPVVRDAADLVVEIGT
jgi:putative ABC transport system ATP-binding protein